MNKQNITMPKTFVIPVSYTVSGCVTVTAMSEKDAIDTALDHIDELPLLDDAEYVDASYDVEMDADLVETFTKLYENREVSAIRSSVVSDAAAKAMKAAAMNRATIEDDLDKFPDLGANA